MPGAAAFATIQSFGDPQKAVEMAQYHKVDRPYLGVANPVLDNLCKTWRREWSMADRLAAAAHLWNTNSHEGMICAAKLLTQARIKESEEDAWTLITSWVPDFDAWAVADHAMMAGQRRITADLTRLDQVQAWTASDHLFTKRAALVITLPFTKQRNPKPFELDARERVLGWAAGYVTDDRWFIQKAVAWWLRDLSKRDPSRVMEFIDQHGEDMKNFAVKEATKYIT